MTLLPMLPFFRGWLPRLGPAKVVVPPCLLPTKQSRAPVQLTGAEFEEWLFDPEHRTLPDFLDMPEVAFGHRLQSGDIRALRALARGRPGEHIPTHLLAGIVRLHANGIIERFTTATGAFYAMSPYSYTVLLHNVSYRGAR